MSAHPHPWTLVAPWYRWDRPGVPSSGRDTAPVFQKFAADDFVNAFLKDPQHSLAFDSATDEVHEVDFFPATAPSAAALAGKISSLFPLNKAGALSPTRTRLRSTGLRKIYLDTHSRHYLVVCELHCDVAGFPAPKPKEVCQAGFVVRRRHLSYPEGARREAAAIVKNLVAVEAELAARANGRATGHSKPKALISHLRTLFGTGGVPVETTVLEQRRVELRRVLDAWKHSNDVHWIHEGWQASAEERIGAWEVVEDTPQELQEAWFPMWPLIPDPSLPQHDAAGRTLFFGVLPTASFDTDAAGRARFDASTTYEVRCFVRRHDPRCPRDDAPDCHGELVWSPPTERYRLAAQFDLQGSANRPVTIQMPDLAELAAQAVGTRLGKFSPVKIIQPQSLMPKVSGGVVAGGQMSGSSICFVSIPLITIVALFVFHIFLPIVVFIFGLWFLLAFKFCIPPKVGFDVNLEAKLDAALQKPSLDADFSLSATLPDGSVVGVNAATLNADLQAGVGAGIEAAHGMKPGKGAQQLGRFPDQRDANGVLRRDGMSNGPLADLAAVMREVDALPNDVASDPPVRGDLSADLVYERRRVPEAVA